MFENNKILILGMARSGYEAAKVLIKRNNTVVLNDSKEESEHEVDKVNELRNLGVKLVFGSHPDDLLDSSFDYLIKNPGIKNNHKYVIKANELGIEVINEVEMAYRLFKNKVTLIGVTGTNGKTTTTTLIYEILKAANKPVYLTGNIGYPVCSFLDKIKDNDIVLMEVSVQQLDNLSTFKPNIVVMTNLSPAHLDFYETYDNYKNIKCKIFNNLTINDLSIINDEDLDTKIILPKIKSKIEKFSSEKTDTNCYILNNNIYYEKEVVISLNDIKVKGTHNYENIMGAIICCKKFNVSNEDIVKVLKTFPGVEHRLEYVKEINKRIFYNDSKATNNESTKIALSAFNQPTILIMGGQNRDQDFNELNNYMSNVKLVICYGENKDKINTWLNELNIERFTLDNLEESTKLAYKKSLEGDIILLSPASASWDQFKSFEVRGEHYKNIINDLDK